MNVTMDCSLLKQLILLDVTSQSEARMIGRYNSLIRFLAQLEPAVV